MRRMRKTKLLATLGPASQDDAIVEKLFEAGADVFRINMSHSSHDVLRARVKQLRAMEKKYDRPVGILADLQGPKLRVGTFKDGSAMLVNGQRFMLDSNPEPGDTTRVHLPHPEILEPLQVGHVVIIDDGKLRLRVIEETATEAVTIVEVGGKISNKKGVSLPDTMIPVSAMTPKDRADLDAALDAGVDWIALSFVQRPEDVAEVKKVARGRAREAAGGGATGRNHGDFRCRHGSARRSRCRNAARKGAGNPEAHHAYGTPHGQTRGGGDADAGKHDHQPGADSRRGFRRGDRRV
jgi:pyruvate kinase